MPSISGWAGRVRLRGSVNDVNLPAIRWSATWSTELVDITHVGDGIVALTGATYPAAQNTLKSYLPSYTDLEVSVDCLWDSSLQPLGQGGAIFGPSSGVAVGTQAKVDLFIDRSSATARFSVRLIIETIVVEEEVRGVAKFSFTGKQTSYLGGVNSTTVQIPGSTSTS